ncbi:hypothetical protein ANCCEY_13128 [Ancylostoma ceylanicum]|uniref:Protein kinase domain-containing protein n=1 Tax=Ancylostoma ceylanicum TaxID=53326 RepID=A0A0D6L7R9_9BILA|nr:hypothetical protein ANCCEY_13128 [Ancylostoma ceylanicum]
MVLSQHYRRLFVAGPPCYAFQYQIVHRDIKPMNVLLDHANGLLKIGDFGSAKVIHKVAKSTAYQVGVSGARIAVRCRILQLDSRYAADATPTVPNVSPLIVVDLWSAGCVVGEMLRGNVLFPGRNGRHQLKLIFLCIGSPTEEDVKLMRVPTRILFEGRVVVGTGLSQVTLRNKISAAACAAIVVQDVCFAALSRSRSAIDRPS